MGKQLADWRQSYTDTTVYIQGGPKKLGTFFTAHNFLKYWPIFKLFFTVRNRRILVLIPSLKIQLHLKCIATLPCEMSLS